MTARERRSPLTLVAVAVGSLALGGCCTGRPQDGGFLCGVGGLAGGGYEGRVREREVAAGEESERSRNLQGRDTQLRHEEARTSAEIARTRRELDDLDRSLAATRKRIRAAEAAHTTDAATIKKAKAQLGEIQGGVKNLQQAKNPSDADLQLLKRRQQQLELLLQEN